MKSIQEQYNSLDLSKLPKDVLEVIKEIKTDSQNFKNVHDFIQDDWDELWNNVIQKKYKTAIKDAKSKVKVGKKDESETIENVLLKSHNVRNKMPIHQQRILVNEHIPTVKRLEKELKAIPKIYAQEGKSWDEKIVYAHYFSGNSDWFITEQNPKENLFFGFTILNGDSQMANMGYSNISELRNHKLVELDFHWKKKSLSQALYEADSSYFKKPKEIKEGENVTSSESQPKKSQPSKKSPKVVKKRAKTTTTKKKPAKRISYEKAEKVERVSDELKFIKRFALMHNKVKTKNQIRLFINALQKAIVEKRIRKTSVFAKEINQIQDALFLLHGKFKTDGDLVSVSISDKNRGHYLSLVGKQAELHSVKLIKSYINLQGKLIPNIKAKNLFNRIANAINNGKISKRDRYWDEIEQIMGTLKSFVKKNALNGELLVSAKELSGLQGIVLGRTSSDSLNGVLTTTPKNTIMSSTDIVKLNFKKLGFIGKWKNLIGDPSAGFRAMIFGKPKMGKSYLAVEFSGYLARHHGTVLYVAKEEGIDDTLQQKLKDKNVAHPDLYVGDYLPKDLSAYDFVFLDSVNKLGLTPEDLDHLNKTYPHTSFIEIYQTTKQGNFRGGNEFQHDVDIVIEVPEKGKAVQYGRFNQGGELNIFSD
jgi:cell division septation protein DedD